MVFGFLKRLAGNLAGAVTREINAAYGENTDFLFEAVAASAALVAYADGDLEAAERSAIVSLIQKHPSLGKLYPLNVIEQTAEAMFKRAESASGRQALARELDDIKGRPNGTRRWPRTSTSSPLTWPTPMASWFSEEEAVLKKVAARLGVDTQQVRLDVRLAGNPARRGKPRKRAAGCSARRLIPSRAAPGLRQRQSAGPAQRGQSVQPAGSVNQIPYVATAPDPASPHSHPTSSHDSPSYSHASHDSGGGGYSSGYSSGSDSGAGGSDSGAGGSTVVGRRLVMDAPLRMGILRPVRHPDAGRAAPVIAVSSGSAWSSSCARTARPRAASGTTGPPRRVSACGAKKSPPLTDSCPPEVLLSAGNQEHQEADMNANWETLTKAQKADLVRPLAAQCKSAGQIAAIPISWNAVVGVVHRN